MNLDLESRLTVTHIGCEEGNRIVVHASGEHCGHKLTNGVIKLLHSIARATCTTSTSTSISSVGSQRREGVTLRV